jgi:tRNA(adenine34) deaminase
MKTNSSSLIPRPSPQSDDERWMSLALQEATQAAEEGEVPVGAVIVHARRIIGRGHNRNESLQDPTAHAEILALSAAANHVHNWRLTGSTLYVTVEPCLMCTGALVLARVKRIVFGTADEKFGACGSVYDIPWDNRFNHRLEVTSGVLAAQCRGLLQEFFRKRRQKP